MRCLQVGRLESEVLPLDETLAISHTLDRMCEQWGLGTLGTVQRH